MALDTNPNWQYWYKAKIINWVDADTVDMDLDLGLHIHVQERFRLYGIDAWEVRGEERENGLMAKKACINRLPPGSEVVIETIRDKKGKYGRYLAKIYQGSREGETINEWLVKMGHAEEANY